MQTAGLWMLPILFGQTKTWRERDTETKLCMQKVQSMWVRTQNNHGPYIISYKHVMESSIRVVFLNKFAGDELHQAHTTSSKNICSPLTTNVRIIQNQSLQNETVCLQWCDMIMLSSTWSHCSTYNLQKVRWYTTCSSLHVRYQRVMTGSKWRSLVQRTAARIKLLAALNQ